MEEALSAAAIVRGIKAERARLVAVAEAWEDAVRRGDDAARRAHEHDIEESGMPSLAWALEFSLTEAQRTALAAGEPVDYHAPGKKLRSP